MRRIHSLSALFVISACATASPDDATNPIYGVEAVQQPTRLLGCSGYADPLPREGTMTFAEVRLVVDADGHVEPSSPRLVRSMGNRGYDALEIAKGCVWSPGLRDGMPVRVRTTRTFRFPSDDLRYTRPDTPEPPATPPPSDPPPVDTLAFAGMR
jgi:hypothetical protein